jgi:hypothetical protein
LANDGNYLWQVPPTPSADCFVRATATDVYHPSWNASNESKAAFTINVPFVDTQPPAVQITAPENGAVLARTVPLKLTASDNVKVLRVEIFLDGVSVGNLTAASISLEWDTRLTSNGPHTIAARVWDVAGNSGNATPVTVTVKNAVVQTGGGGSLLAADWWAVAAVVAAAVFGAIIGLRRKKSGA